MRLLDRYILSRFLANFAILFMLLYLFAVVIDLILNLDEFVDAAQDEVSDGPIRLVFVMGRMVLNFQGPRLFQFFAYLHGLVGIGAMGFVLGQMHRHKELVAMMASGVSLHRVAMPFVVGVFLISAVQMVNQEVLLPRVAPLLLRGHGEVGRQGAEDFPVPLTQAADRSLFHSPRFDPNTGTLDLLTVLERDETGRTARRITADRAVWDPAERAWRLTEGRVMRTPSAERRGPGEGSGGPRALDLYPTSLDPALLIVRRYGEYAAMLSLRQIAEMLERPGIVDTDTLLRHRYSRFATVLINILVLLITLPSFLLREPVSLIRQALIGAALTLPVMLGGIILMTVDLPGISPLVGVFLPVILMLPIAMVRLMYVRT